MECTKCGKEMTSPEGEDVIALRILVDFTPRDVKLQEFVQKQMGKYALNKAYYFCYECWLDSLFGRGGK